MDVLVRGVNYFRKLIYYFYGKWYDLEDPTLCLRPLRNFSNASL